jgi:hypothetical protein
LKTDPSFKEFSQAQINVLDFGSLFRSISSSSQANPSFVDSLMNHCLGGASSVQKVLSFGYLLRVIYRAKLVIAKQIFETKKEEKEQISDDLTGFLALFTGSNVLHTIQKQMENTSWAPILSMMEGETKFEEIL